jgi:hypothetical protein
VKHVDMLHMVEYGVDRPALHGSLGCRPFVRK